MSLIAKKLLLAVVFFTGAAVLIIEVVAVRILTPYFGSTMYTVSSVLSVVLAALSLGYYLGGSFADRHPQPRWFYLIIFTSGVATVLLQVIVNHWLAAWAPQLSLVSGPLLMSLLLFLLPSFLLGTLSPIVIKLLSLGESVEVIGKLSGQAFFWSTLGSIVGSLVAGFVLIPRLGVGSIVTYLSISLLIVGGGGYLCSVKKKVWVIVGLIVAICLAWGIVYSTSRKNDVVYQTDGVYQKIAVIDKDYRGRPARLLMLDHNPSSGIYLDTGDIAFDYTQYYKLYKYFVPEVQKMLVLGGGAYDVPGKMLEEQITATIDVVEIEPSLLKIAQQYFHLPTDARLVNHATDARVFLAQTDGKYDFIFSDIYHSLYGVPAHCTTKEYFSLVKNRLQPNGVVVVNAIGTLTQQKESFLMSEIKTFRAIFPNSYFMGVNSPGSARLQNVIMIGVNGNTVLMADLIKKKKLTEPTIVNSIDKLIDLDRFDWNQYQVLTDDYSPVDYFNAMTLKQVEMMKYNFVNGGETMAFLEKLVNFGPRYNGSVGLEQSREFLVKEMRNLTSDVIEQKLESVGPDGKNYLFSNIIARFQPEKKDRIILATHYDTRAYTKDGQKDFVGANDGASGVAVLRQVAEYLTVMENKLPIGVDIIFFDGEEGYPLPEDKTLSIGAEYFAASLKKYYRELPKKALVIDMVGDRDLKFYLEKTSLANDEASYRKLFAEADKFYPENFISQVKYGIADDHTVLQAKNIPSMLLIDFDYPYFHTNQDTIDKVSSVSLQKVGNVIVQYLYSEYK